MSLEPSARYLWGQLDRWSYYHYPADADAGQFGRAASLVELWHTKKAGRALPSWADFDFFDFVGWHGWISIFEIRHNPLDWQCRLSGTYVDQLTGSTFQNKTRDEVFDHAITDGSLAFFEHTLKAGVIGWSVGPINRVGREHTNVQYIELPCSNDGRQVDHTIEVMLARF